MLSLKRLGSWSKCAAARPLALKPRLLSRLCGVLWANHAATATSLLLTTAPKWCSAPTSVGEAVQLFAYSGVQPVKLAGTGIESAKQPSPTGGGTGVLEEKITLLLHTKEWRKRPGARPKKGKCS